MKKLILTLLVAGAALPARAAETGCIYDLKGTVETRAAGAADWAPAAKGRPFAEGAAVRTAPDAWCELLLRDGSFVKLDGGSEFAAEQLKVSGPERFFSFLFSKGRALLLAGKSGKASASKFSVRTPSAVCAVRGTDFAVDVGTAGQTTVGLFEGLLSVASGGAEKELTAGSEAAAGPAGLTVAGRLSKLMEAEKRRCAGVKGRVERLRKRLAERDDFIDDYIGRQQKRLEDFEKRRSGKLNGKK